MPEHRLAEGHGRETREPLSEKVAGPAGPGSPVKARRFSNPAAATRSPASAPRAGEPGEVLAAEGVAFPGCKREVTPGQGSRKLPAPVCQTSVFTFCQVERGQPERERGKAGGKRGRSERGGWHPLAAAWDRSCRDPGKDLDARPHQKRRVREEKPPATHLSQAEGSSHSPHPA